MTNEDDQRDDILRRLLKTPPTPHKSIGKRKSKVKLSDDGDVQDPKDPADKGAQPPKN